MTPQERKVFELALEALETCYAGDYSTGHVIDPSFDEDAVKEAIIAIKEALAQPEQESVAFPRNVQEYDEDWIIDPAFLTRVKHSIDPETPYEFTPSEEQIETTLLALEVIPSPLYTTPPQREVEHAMRLYKAVERLSLQAGEETEETIDWLCGEHGGMFKLFQAYFSPRPPQRTWVGLMRGVRVEGDTVVISTKDNDAARDLCGALIEEMNK